jgi:hypothetical protein
VGRLITEDRSRPTDENAKFAKAIADPKLGERWLLVTSAHQMPRAVGAFGRAGFLSGTRFPFVPDLRAAWQDVESSFERFRLTAGVGALEQMLCGDVEQLAGAPHSREEGRIGHC